MTQDFKNTITTLLNDKNEQIIQHWLEFFNEEDKDEQHRYYDDFLGFLKSA
ncbi:MAG: hypothetical protein U9O56_02210 [Campylobacterota bacterium]|nr:hypothetical protein [Campylobacterota bacterium]